MDRLNVAHVVSYIGAEASGPAYSVPALCNALAKHNVDVTLYTLAPLPEKEFLFPVKSFPRSKYPVKSLGRSPEMYQTLLRDSKDVDVIHNHGLWMAPNIYAGLVTTEYGIPFVNAPRGTLSAEALKRSQWKKKLVLKLGQQKSLNTTSVFHATAVHEEEDIKSYMGNKPSFVIPNGIDIPRLMYKESPKTYKKLLFLGRIHSIKGLENLLMSWHLLASEFLDWELAIVGVGKPGYVRELKDIIKEKGIERVLIKPAVYGEEKTKCYQDADLYVLPSFSENFGMTVAEAMANGLPVITTNATPWSALNDRKAGWCIDVGLEPLTNCLKQVLKLDVDELTLLGKNAREWMKEEYSWDKIARDMIVEYQKLIKRNE